MLSFQLTANQSKPCVNLAKRLLQEDRIAVMFLRLGGEKRTRLRGQICVNQTPKKHTLTLQEHHMQQRGISETTAPGSR